jgi:threonine synthase
MVLESYNSVTVLRDDLLPGGTKSVFLPKLLEPGFDSYVYASPAYGGFQIALAAVCRAAGKQAVVFTADRKVPHTNTVKAKNEGARVFMVRAGYLNVVQARAKEFCRNNNAQYLEFGANYPAAIEAIAGRMRAVTKQLGREPQRIVCALGSGTLLKGIIEGTDYARVTAVQVGKPYFEALPERVNIITYPKPFEYETKAHCPFPSMANYDRKAWEYVKRYAGREDVLFWNVYG